ncbi:MAG: hypothetical protein EOO52_03780 [Gammaproteobacteria bacterium]|nr:MAG: hypothetical protein EOO52_03780 [Gammaproteobacteria bacterium]
MLKFSEINTHFIRAGYESVFVRDDKPCIQSIDGSCREYDSLYVMLGEERGVELAKQAGAASNSTGKLIIDKHQRSTLNGLYAIGDLVSSLHQVSVAAGQAAIASTHIHNTLAKNFVGA